MLAAEFGSVSFARRHGEVVNLVLDTLRNIEMLPTASRQRLLGYVPAWWTAVLSPLVNWQRSDAMARSVIGASDLDHLGKAADLIEARLAGTATAPAGEILLGLKAQVEEWRALVAEATELAQPVRDVLEGQIAHLLWLIEEVPRFGVARVANESQGLVGALVQAAPRITNSERKGRWKTQLGSLCIALGLLTGALKESEAALEAFAGNIGALDEVVHQARELVGPDKQAHISPPSVRRAP